MFDWFFHKIDGSVRIRDNQNLGGGDGDVFLGRLVKIIPAEAMAVYPIGKAATQAAYAGFWPIFLAAVVFGLRLRATGSKKFFSPQLRNVMLSVATFLAWVVANGDPLLGFELDMSDYGGQLVIWFGLGWIAWVLATPAIAERDPA
ncbi:MAG: hypothetical protein CMK09_05380 [Ponticaulis sp.]|nr:hypothetical protein [Ponticaulis sp.]|tara:strand:- start:1295 stop:1732 length:438 start_codon:yes stop_codon:yes gene_type:complete